MCSGYHLLGICRRPGQGIEGSLQLNNVADRFWDERRPEFFFNNGFIGFVELSELISDSDNKREDSFKKKDNGGHSSQNIGH